MIDLSGMPLPENAPEPGRCVRVERPAPGLVHLVLDPPHREHTVIDLCLLRDLDLALDQIASDGALRGLVIRGRTPLHFAFGADLDAIEAVTDPDEVVRFVKLGHQVFARIEDMKRVSTVAAVGGPVLGGALELSLACNTIVAARHPSTRVGLPEVRLGILPAWGGSHRLPRRLGVPAALQAILQGRAFGAEDAKRRGIFDRITVPDFLWQVADGIAQGHEKPRKKKRGSSKWWIDKNPLATKLIARKAKESVLSETHGHYPAPLAALEIVVDALRTGPEEAAEKEAEAAARLATGDVCKHLIGVFRATEKAKKLGHDEAGERVPLPKRAGIIGGGVMGGGIASLFASNGVATRLADLSQDALDRALAAHQSAITRRLKRRRLRPHEAAAALDRLDAVQDAALLGSCDLVVEAVAERLEVKRAVFGAVAGGLPDDAILATNTSSLSVDAIAEGLPHPERVIGMHFFNPVARMPLVEIVRGKATDERHVRTIAALAIKAGKTPVVVADVAGFLVNRLLGPYLDEALRLFAGGFDPARLDRLLVDFGMPMGPLRLLDEVGFDVAHHAAESLHEAYGARMTPSDALDAMLAKERLGKKSGEGFYRHPSGGGKKGPKPSLSPDLASFRRGDSLSALSDRDALDRCLLAMVAEGVRALDEKVVAGPVELDVATVMGMGFAPFRGGLLHYADSAGLGSIVERLQALLQAPDIASRQGGPERFEPPALLQRLAGEKRSFH